MTVKKGSSEERDETSSTSSPEQSTNSGSLVLNISVCFSTFPLRILKKFGTPQFEIQEGYLYSSERMVNILEWEYPGPFSKPDEFHQCIFVDCSDTDGLDIRYACVDTENIDWKNFSRSSLIEKVVFAVRQMKDYLFGIEKDSPPDREVKFTICAFHPFECCLFAFQRALGLTFNSKEAEYKELYKNLNEYIDRNNILANLKQWMKDHGWENVSLDYCSVHQFYRQEIVALSPLARAIRKLDEIEKFSKYLEIATSSLRRSMSETSANIVRLSMVGGSGHEKLLERHEQERKKFEDIGYIVKKDGVNIVNNVYVPIYVPYVIFDDKLCNLQDIKNVIAEQEKEIQDEFKLETLEKKKQQIKEDVKRKEAEMRKDVSELEARGIQIEQKQKLLKAQKTKGTVEYQFWEERYAQDYQTQSQADDQTDLKKEEARQKIEFEGELLDEKQLEAKRKENKKLILDRKGEFVIFRDIEAPEMENYYDKLIDKAKLEKQKEEEEGFATALQMGLAVVGLIAVAVVAAPIAATVAAGVFVAVAEGVAIGTTVASIGIECYKWAAIDEGANIGEHILSIGLDVLTFKMGPLFRIPRQSLFKNATKLLGKLDEGIEVLQQEKSLVEIEKLKTPPIKELEEELVKGASQQYKDYVKYKEMLAVFEKGGEEASMVIINDFTNSAVRKLSGNTSGLKRAIRKAKRSAGTETSNEAIKGVKGEMEKIVDQLKSNNKVVADGERISGEIKNAKSIPDRLQDLADQLKNLGEVKNTIVEIIGGEKPKFLNQGSSGFMADFLGIGDELKAVGKLEECFNVAKIDSTLLKGQKYREAVYGIAAAYHTFHVGYSVVYTGISYFNPNFKPDDIKSLIQEQRSLIEKKSSE